MDALSSDIVPFQAWSRPEAIDEHTTTSKRAYPNPGPNVHDLPSVMWVPSPGFQVVH